MKTRTNRDPESFLWAQMDEEWPSSPLLKSELLSDCRIDFGDGDILRDDNLAMVTWATGVVRASIARSEWAFGEVIAAGNDHCECGDYREEDDHHGEPGNQVGDVSGKLHFLLLKVRACARNQDGNKPDIFIIA